MMAQCCHNPNVHMIFMETNNHIRSSSELINNAVTALLCAGGSRSFCLVTMLMNLVKKKNYADKS